MAGRAAAAPDPDRVLPPAGPRAQRDRVLTRDALFEAIWGFDMSATANNLQVYVSYLRRKMEAEGEPRLIYTLRGLGYTLRETPL